MVSQISLSDSFEVVSPLELSELLLFEKNQSGSNGDASTVTSEDDEPVFSGHSPPSDAADAAEEWRLPKAFRSFYFVKHHPCDDSEIRAKIDEADKEIYQCNVTRIEICNSFKVKRAERSALYTQMKCLNSECDVHNGFFYENKRESEHLKEALVKLGITNGDQLCYLEKELDDLICNMYYQNEQEGITWMEEELLLREIKRREGTREKIIANSAFKSKIHDSLGQKGAVIDHVKAMMPVNTKEGKKNRQEVTAKINRLSEKLERTKMEMESLNAALTDVLDRRDKAFERIKMLRRQRDLMNAAYFQSRSVMMRTRELATAGNVKGLEELANAEVERFMSLWNTDKAFRDEYEERVSASLDKRQLSRDGRSKNLQEDPLVAGEAQRPRGIRADGVARARDERRREDSSSCSSRDGNAAKETTKEADSSIKSSSKESDCMASDVPRHQKPQTMEEEVNEETLKEKKREEQLEKAREAMKRKRKMQEKAAVKAAIRAQKEAEKKLKKLEKKTKEKAAANPHMDQDENPEAVTEASEPEKAEASTVAKGKRTVLPKPRTLRFRHRRSGAEAPPKAIMKRRKANKFWVWAASSAAFALALLTLLILEFFLRQM